MIHAYHWQHSHALDLVFYLREKDRDMFDPSIISMFESQAEKDQNIIIRNFLSSITAYEANASNTVITWEEFVQYTECNKQIIKENYLKLKNLETVNKETLEVFDLSDTRDIILKVVTGKLTITPPE